MTRKALIVAIQQFIFNNVWILKCLRRLIDHSTFSKSFETLFKSNWLHAAITGTRKLGGIWEGTLGAVNVIKDQIQCRSQSLLNLARDYFSSSATQTKVVRLLIGYHSNADNKFMDDYKASISFEGKNRRKENTKRFFRHVFVDSCKIHSNTSLNILNSRVVFSPTP